MIQKPLTPLMIDHLRLAKEIERQQGEKYYSIDLFKSTLSGLVRRGFVETKMIYLHGKRLLAVYLTETAHDFVEQLEPKR